MNWNDGVMLLKEENGENLTAFKSIMTINQPIYKCRISVNQSLLLSLGMVIRLYFQKREKMVSLCELYLRSSRKSRRRHE